MLSRKQKWMPGIVGISTYVDYAYLKEMQLAALAAAGAEGPINQLRTATVTLDFNRLIVNLQAGQRDAAEEQVTGAVQALAAAGANFVVVTSGTTSTLTAAARKKVSIPFLDLGEAAWQEVPRADGSVGILCTSYAAAGGIFQSPAPRHGGTVVLPSQQTAREVDEVIFRELVRGQVSQRVLTVLCAAISELARAGAGSIILGNTDMTLAAAELQKSSPVPLIDSAKAHARAAARAALAGRL